MEAEHITYVLDDMQGSIYNEETKRRQAEVKRHWKKIGISERTDLMARYQVEASKRLSKTLRMQTLHTYIDNLVCDGKSNTLYIIGNLSRTNRSVKRETRLRDELTRVRNDLFYYSIKRFGAGKVRMRSTRKIHKSKDLYGMALTDPVSVMIHDLTRSNPKRFTETDARLHIVIKIVKSFSRRRLVAAHVLTVRENQDRPGWEYNTTFPDDGEDAAVSGEV